VQVNIKHIHQNPTDWSTHVILGLDDINRSRDAKRPDEERAASYTSGTKHIEKAFRANNKNAAAANALSEFFLRKGDTNNVIFM
jgi:RNA polymerase-associated protein CTR9